MRGPTARGAIVRLVAMEGFRLVASGVVLGLLGGAAMIPARRAARVNPMVAIQVE